MGRARDEGLSDPSATDAFTAALERYRADGAPLEVNAAWRRHVAPPVQPAPVRDVLRRLKRDLFALAMEAAARPLVPPTPAPAPRALAPRRPVRPRLVLALTAALVMATVLGGWPARAPRAAGATVTEFITVGTTTTFAANGSSGYPSVSGDGRYVAFESDASNLVAGDTNGWTDVFVYDRTTQTTERVSLTATGAQATGGNSQRPRISSDGRYVAFESAATDLVTGDTNGLTDVFVKDRNTGEIERVSVNASGAQATGGASRAPSISDDGRYVAFESDATNLATGDTNGTTDIFVFDRSTGQLERVSVTSGGAQATGHSRAPAISATDGRYVAFESDASDLVADDANGSTDVFVYDRTADTIQRVSIATDGTEGDDSSAWAAISADGRYVAFQSSASTIAGGQCDDNVSATEAACSDAGATWDQLDQNFSDDVFVRDRHMGVTERVSLNGAAEVSDNSQTPAISGDGRYVAFATVSPDLGACGGGIYGIVVYDRTADQSTATASPCSDDAASPAISGDGGYVAYQTDLEAPSWDFVIDVVSVTRAGGSSRTASAGGSGAVGDAYSDWAMLSETGRYVLFYSDATNLVTGDTNGVGDIFVRDRQAGATERVSMTAGGAQAAGGASSGPAMTPDGRYVAFESSATNLVTGDTNNAFDVFVKDRTTGAVDRVSTTASGGQATDFSSSGTPSISADGRFVAFQSTATNLVTGDTNALRDIFVKDRSTGAIERVNTTGEAAQATGAGKHSESPAISADGRYVAFQSSAANLVTGDTNAGDDIFVKDRTTGAIERVSVSSAGAQAAGSVGNLSRRPRISADGRYVAFESDATNLVTGDTNNATDVFLYDRTTLTIERVSVKSDGTQANGGSYSASISADGRYVTYDSDATDLVTGDTNAMTDVFLFDRTTRTVQRVSVSSAGSQLGDASFSSAISADGLVIAFSSAASEIASDDFNGVSDILVRDLDASPPAPTPAPTATPTAAPGASPTVAPSATPQPTATAEPTPSPTPTAAPIDLPAVVQPGASPIIVVDRPVTIPSTGVVTQEVRFETSGATVSIPAGVTVLVGGQPSSVTLLPPVVRMSGDLPTVEFTSESGEPVSFEPPIEVTLALPSAHGLAHDTAGTAYVPVELREGAVTGCLTGTATGAGIRFSVARAGTFALRGPERSAVQRSLPLVTYPSLGLGARFAGGSLATAACPGQLVDVTVSLLNSGTTSWIRGTSTQVNLGTNAPPGNTRDFDQGVLIDPLFGRDRFATMGETWIDPGAVATFSFRLRAPATSGTYRVYMRPVVEGVRWLEDEGMYFEMEVRPLASMSAR